MLFSSMFFLSVFLPVVILLYFLTGKRYRQHILLVASLFFYCLAGGDLLHAAVIL